MIAGESTSVMVNGRIAYASQRPWIMSASVRDNITFESPYEEDKFNKVLHFASLEQDIKILPFGVDTEIG
jgi:ABC-type multidrug transport system fused ATPase/permease subunit